MAVDAATVTLPLVVAQAVAAIALGLLGAGGIMKLIDPEPTTGAMNVAHLPSSNAVSRLLGLVEMGVTIAALSIAGPSVLLAAGLYAAFAVFTVVAIVSGIPIQSCGCFGKEDTPPTAIHMTFNVFAAIALLWVFFSGRSAIDWALPTLELVLYLGFTVIGVYTTYLLMTRLPQLLELTSSR